MNKLQKIAEEATSPWPGWAVTNKDAEFLHTFRPERVLELLAVVRAAQQVWNESDEYSSDLGMYYEVDDQLMHNLAESLIVIGERHAQLDNP